MKPLLKTVLVLVITVKYGLSQNPMGVTMDDTRTIYKQSFNTNSTTTLVLNFKYTGAQILTSNDDKVHVEYVMRFKNYKEKQIENIVNRVKFSGKHHQNKITLNASFGNRDVYMFYKVEDILDNRQSRFLNDTVLTETPVAWKPLDTIVSTIKNSDNISLREKLRGSYKSKPGKKKWKKSDKLQTTTLKIYLPKHVHLRASLENAQLYFNTDFYNQVTINARRSKLKFKTVGNPLNRFDIDKGYFYANAITEGFYNLSNTKSVIIGSLSNSRINSEFTNVEIGQVGKNNTITDFTSTYIFYNWQPNFYNFKFVSEYSKTHLFKPTTNYGLTLFGNNIKHILQGVNANLLSSTNGKKYLVMEKKPNDTSPFSGQIDFDILNGILYTYNVK